MEQQKNITDDENVSLVKQDFFLSNAQQNLSKATNTQLDIQSKLTKVSNQILHNFHIILAIIDPNEANSDKNLSMEWKYDILRAIKDPKLFLQKCQSTHISIKKQYEGGTINKGDVTMSRIKLVRLQAFMKVHQETLKNTEKLKDSNLGLYHQNYWYINLQFFVEEAIQFQNLKK